MSPTQRLRFVERFTPVIGTSYGGTRKVLQQWWEDNSTDVHWVDGKLGEWRDVPLENEQ